MSDDYDDGQEDCEVQQIYVQHPRIERWSYIDLAGIAIGTVATIAGAISQGLGAISNDLFAHARWVREAEQAEEIETWRRKEAAELDAMTRWMTATDPSPKEGTDG